jgi:DHA2 family multidrug resistance protein
MSSTTANAAPRRAPPAAAVSDKLTAGQWVGFMAMVFGMFMAILDIQIVSASISDIQAGLAASPDESSWVQTSYLIAEIVMIPLSGFLSRLLSTRVLFVASAAGFTFFSALCAMASNLEMMIVARALQGFVGGAMIPTVFATSYLLFPGPKRVQISVLIGLTATLAPTIGPTLGGWLTQVLSWHWLFLINVPIGAAIAVVVWRTLDIDKPDHRLFSRFDWWGLGLMATFLGSLEYVMEEGPRWDWLGDPTIRNLAILAALSGVAFFWRTLTRDEPIVELRAYANRNFAIGSLFSFIAGVGLYGSVYLIPIFLGRVRGYDSLQIGEVMFITGLMMFIGAPIAGRLARAIDLRVMLAMGLVTYGASVWMTASLTATSSFAELAFPLGLRGFAMMFLMLPVNQVALGTLPAARLKNASGLYNLMRNLGGAVGLALINTMVTDRSYMHRLHLDEQVTWSRQGAVDTLAAMSGAYGRVMESGTADLAALRQAAAMVQREALIMAYNDALMAMAVLFFVAAPLVVLVSRPRGAGGDAH